MVKSIRLEEIRLNVDTMWIWTLKDPYCVIVYDDLSIHESIPIVTRSQSDNRGFDQGYQSWTPFGS